MGVGPEVVGSEEDAQSNPAGLSAYLTALQQQRIRQMKRLQQLQALHTHRLSQEAARLERERREEERQQELQRQRREHLAATQRRLAEAEKRRKEKLAAAQQREEALRQQMAAKLQLGAQRAQAVQAARHEVAVVQRVRNQLGARQKMQAVLQRAALEEQEKQLHVVQKMVRHEIVVQKAMQERREAEIARREEEERREAARRQTLARAEQELAAKADYYRQRQQQKEAELQQRHSELAQLRALKQREKQMRADYVRHRVELAAQQDEQRREALSCRLSAKQQRVAAMEEEKGAMLRALDLVRQEIQMQEEHLRDALRLMDAGGDTTVGKELEQLQRELAEVSRPGSGGRTLSSRPSSRGSSSHKGSRPCSAGYAATAAAKQSSASQRGAGATSEFQATTAKTDADACGLVPSALRHSSSTGQEACDPSPRIQAVHGGYAELLPQAGAGAADVAGSVDYELPTGLQSCEDGADDVRPTGAPGCCDAQAAQADWHDDEQEDQQACQQQQQHEAEQQHPLSQPLPALSPELALQKLQQILEAELGREAERAALLRSAQDERDRARLEHFFRLERQNAMGLMENLQRCVEGRSC